MGRDHLELIHSLLHEMHAATTPFEAMAVCRRLLRITLADGLTPTAWEVLEAVVDHDPLWQGAELTSLLQEYRLPTDRAELRRQSYAHSGTDVSEV